MPKIGELLIFGEASGKLIKIIEVYPRHLEETLMNFLLINNVPVASSCNGEGVCKKCQLTIENEVTLSCQISMRNLLVSGHTCMLKFSYL